MKSKEDRRKNEKEKWKIYIIAYSSDDEIEVPSHEGRKKFKKFHPW